MHLKTHGWWGHKYIQHQITYIRILIPIIYLHSTAVIAGIKEMRRSFFYDISRYVTLGFEK